MFFQRVSQAKKSYFVSKRPRVGVTLLPLACFLLYSCKFGNEKNTQPEAKQNSVTGSMLSGLKSAIDGFFLSIANYNIMTGTATYEEPFFTESDFSRGESEATQPQSAQALAQTYTSLAASHKPLPATIMCSNWFETFLRDEQKEFSYKGARGSEVFLMQFRHCRGPMNEKLINLLFMRWQDTFKSLGRGKPPKWNIYRGIPAKFHALVSIQDHLHVCAPWKAELNWFKPLGTQINYSYMRNCSFKCDKNDDALNCKSKVQLKWQEFAEFPTKDFLARQETSAPTAPVDR